MNIFNFFTDQILGMKWLSNLITLFVENLLDLDITSRLGGIIYSGDNYYLSIRYVLTYISNKNIKNLYKK